MEFILIPNLKILVGGSVSLSTLIMLFGIWVTLKQDGLDDIRRWLNFVVAVTISLIILQTGVLILQYLTDYPFGLVALLLAPVITCVIVIVLVKWKDWAALGDMARKSRLFLLLFLTTLLGINIVGMPGIIPAVIFIAVLATWFWVKGTNAGDKILGVTSLIVANWYFLDVMGIINIFLRNPTSWLQTAIGLLNLLVTILIILIPGILIFICLQGHLTNEAGSNWFRVAAALALIGIAAYGVARNARWASENVTLVEEVYPFLQLLTASVTGMLLTITLRKDRRIFGPAYTFLVSFLIIITFNQSWNDAIEEFKRQASLFP